MLKNWFVFIMQMVQRRRKSGLEGKTPDLMRTLTEKDIRDVVYSVADKPYMQTYIGMLQMFRDKGIINQEPDLNYIASKIVESLYFYGMFSVLSRTRPTKGKEVLASFTEDERGVPATYSIRKNKDYAMFCKDDEMWLMAPIRLIRALRTRELRNLNDLDDLDPAGRKKTSVKIGRSRIK